MHRLTLVVVSVVVLAACKTDNPMSCELAANAGTGDCIDGGSGGGPCTMSSECTSMTSTPVCDVNAGKCAQCTTTSHDLCIGTTPRCEADACVACIDDNDCSGTGVCLPDGSCAATSSIIHAIANGGSKMSTTCGGIGAGNACNLDTALSIAKAGRNVIKLDTPAPAAYASEMNNFTVDADVAVNLVLDARGAVVHHNGNGAIFSINTNKGMTILGGVIEGAQMGGGDGIQCKSSATLAVYGTSIRTNDESGIDASGCTLVVVNADIRDNSKSGGAGKFAGIQANDGTSTVSRSVIASNRGGGITVSGNGVFKLVGNAFLGNGDPTGVAGGVSFLTGSAGNRLDFNTFAENKAMAGVGAGVQCTVTGLTAKNNIVWNNNGAGGTQVGGTCLHAYSDIGPTAVVAGLDGGNNSSPPADPMFKGPTTDLSVTAASPVRGKASPDADLTGIALKDIAGKSRTNPADLGAYVVPAQ
jgi:parallel beta helix pectate lyase-like protein